MRRWSEDEEALLARLWGRADMRAAEIAEKIGRPLRATYVKACRLGLPSKPDPNTIRLTKQEQLWLTRNYPHMRTQICADHLGMSLRSCVRWARRLGVEKSAEFMRETQAVTARLAKESHLRNGTYPAKGVVNANLAKGAAYRFKRSTIND